MKGNIITTEKCMVCGATLKHDDRRHGLFCPNHPQISCVKVFVVRFGRHIQRQFNRKNPKIWLGIDLLATYVNLRPGDLLKIKEKDIDLEHGVITIHNPTKAKNKIKTVRLLPEHVKGIQELKDQFPALPELKFFRHHGGVRLRPQVF